MTDHVIEIADQPARLSLSVGRLIVDQPSGRTAAVPVGEISVLVLAHPQITITQPALAGLAEAGAAVVACDSKRLPVAMMLPMRSHSIQAERMAKQASVTLPTRKRVWKQVVQAKVRAQARTLTDLRGSDGGLAALAGRVRPGDPENIEAQAAVRYWRLVFGRPEFRRSPDAPDENRFLNYGYTVLRAMVARSVCAAGLHPSLGIHHHNRYDAYQLADDLMEPFRPVVDRAVVRLSERIGPRGEMSAAAKAAIVGALSDRYSVGNEMRVLGDLIQQAAMSLCGVFTGRRRDLDLGVP